MANKVLLLLLSVLSVRGTRSTPTRRQVPTYINKDGFRCQHCPVGTYLQQQCNENYGEPICNVCPDNTFSDQPHQAVKCAHCSQCDINHIQVAACTKTHDTKCGCPEGHSYDPRADGFCVKSNLYKASNGLWCQVCSAGSFVIAPCKQNSGLSDCKVCPSGTFSRRDSHATSCEYCSVCQMGQFEKEPCSAVSDTICECPPRMYWKLIVGEQGVCRYHTVCKPDAVMITPGTATSDTFCQSKPVMGEPNSKPTGLVSDTRSDTILEGHKKDSNSPQKIDKYFTSYGRDSKEPISLHSSSVTEGMNRSSSEVAESPVSEREDSSKSIKTSSEHHSIFDASHSLPKEKHVNRTSTTDDDSFASDNKKSKPQNNKLNNNVQSRTDLRNYRTPPGKEVQVKTKNTNANLLRKNVNLQNTADNKIDIGSESSKKEHSTKHRKKRRRKCRKKNRKTGKKCRRKKRQCKNKTGKGRKRCRNRKHKKGRNKRRKKFTTIPPQTNLNSMYTVDPIY